MTDNKYERLKWKDWPEAPDLSQEKEIPLSKHPAELVTLMISTTPQGGLGMGLQSMLGEWPHILLQPDIPEWSVHGGT